MSESLKPLKWYKDLAGQKERREAGVFLVEGERAVSQVLAQHPESIREILATFQPTTELERYPVRILTENQLKSISHSVTPQDTIALVSMPEDCYNDTPPDAPGKRILMLEDVQDPGNTGTLIRTAAAFNYDGIILSEKCADPFSPKCIQASAGAVLSLWIRRTASYAAIAAGLREDGWQIAAAALEGTDDVSVLESEKLILVLGNEAAGISERLRTLSSHIFQLPIAREKAESLNVSVCGGICMYLSSR